MLVKVLRFHLGQCRVLPRNPLRFATTSYSSFEKIRGRYDIVVVGGGHNGLVAAAYLAGAGHSVCVLERRHILGGAVVTEELVPGFKFSRASYVLSLLRPQIYRDLELKRHGLRIHIRDPSSYTPLREPSGKARSLLLGLNAEANAREIAKFSARDAENFAAYNLLLEKIAKGIEPLLDSPPIDLQALKSVGWRAFKDQWPAFRNLLKAGSIIGSNRAEFFDLMTAPAEKFLCRWFESEPLKATLATDAVIGAHQSPRTPGSGYTLLHHVMGGVEDTPGAWGYVEGGMGALSDCIASSAREKGAEVFTECEVEQLLTNSDGAVTGVRLRNNKEISANVVLSNATAHVTFKTLLPQRETLLSEDQLKQLDGFSYTSPVTKINVAVSKIPTFTADATPGVQPLHRGTIHLNSETCEEVHQAFIEAENGHWSSRPVIEMTIPSSLDPTISPPGQHVVQLFTQYTPFTLAGKEWTEKQKKEYAETVFDQIEEYSPGFKNSILGTDILTPPDLQEVFGLTGGNIFHGAITLDQIYLARPTSFMSNYRSPIKGLYLCGSSAHPGGGVMGSAGRLAANRVISDLKSKTLR